MPAHESGAKLTCNDPQPPIGTVVKDDGVYGIWEHCEANYGGSYWLRPPYDGEPESWMKIAGNYGPVTVVSVGIDD